MAIASDGVRLAPESIEKLDRLAAAYKESDKKIQAGLRKGLQSAAKPLAELVIREGSAKMPHRGGLSARVASSRPSISTLLSGRTASIALRLGNKWKDSLAGLDTGKLRHPVFGEKRLRISSGGVLSSAWVAQTVPEHAFTDAFKEHAPKFRDEVNAEIARALDEIANEAT